MAIKGELMTGSKKGVALLEAAICHLLIVVGTYFYMRKHYNFYRKQNTPLFKFTKCLFRLKHTVEPEDEMIDEIQSSYDEFC